ncbi:MarR family winged helix-turn-helix transcriptional regulator [Vallitalea okinawensis]|uniref:MarR family winged helix-turn-helix transcriptional regulator n=1 Tax=Vallitalea okinawensis TaxID=2078660 RepID=UPI000CFDEC49|nr:MarR family winged helix-turn-helix transcriptional regulator [Vallitalea okinawensis]
MSQDKGNQIHKVFDQYMPYYFRYINPIIHKEKNEIHSLNENQIKALLAINHFRKATPTLLSHALNIQKGSLTTIIKALIKMDLIIKEYDVKDERTYYLQLTPSGQEFVKYKEKKIIVEFNNLFESMDEESLKKVVDGFNALVQHFISLE